MHAAPPRRAGPGCASSRRACTLRGHSHPQTSHCGAILQVRALAQRAHLLLGDAHLRAHVVCAQERSARVRCGGSGHAATAAARAGGRRAARRRARRTLDVVVHLVRDAALSPVQAVVQICTSRVGDAASVSLSRHAASTALRTGPRTENDGAERALRADMAVRHRVNGRRKRGSRWVVPSSDSTSAAAHREIEAKRSLHTIAGIMRWLCWLGCAACGERHRWQGPGAPPASKRAGGPVQSRVPLP